MDVIFIIVFRIYWVYIIFLFIGFRIKTLPKKRVLRNHLGVEKAVVSHLAFNNGISRSLILSVR